MSALAPPNLDAYAPAAIAFVMICSFNSGEHFKVNPQRLQRIRKLPPSGIMGMKNKVNHRFDSMAVNTVARLQLGQGYWICLMGFDFVRMPKRNNMPCSLPAILTRFASHDSMEPADWLRYESDKPVGGAF